MTQLYLEILKSNEGKRGKIELRHSSKFDRIIYLGMQTKMEQAVLSLKPPFSQWCYIYLPILCT